MFFTTAGYRATNIGTPITLSNQRAYFFRQRGMNEQNDINSTWEEVRVVESKLNYIRNNIPRIAAAVFLAVRDADKNSQ